MANHMQTYVRISGLTPEGEQLVKDIFTPVDEDVEVHTDTLLERLYGSTEEQISERAYRTENIGSKWVYAYLEYAEDGEAEISSQSAWSVPYQMYLELSKKLMEVSPEAVILGTYEDEGLDPCGAFIIANGYDDIEDVFGTDDIDHERYWEDDDYRDFISQEIYEESNNMYAAYQEYLQELKEEINE